jgi:hypothetical protein
LESSLADIFPKRTEHGTIMKPEPAIGIYPIATVKVRKPSVFDESS